MFCGVINIASQIVLEKELQEALSNYWNVSEVIEVIDLEVMVIVLDVCVTCREKWVYLFWRRWVLYNTSELIMALLLKKSTTVRYKPNINTGCFISIRSIDNSRLYRHFLRHAPLYKYSVHASKATLHYGDAWKKLCNIMVS